MKVGRFTTQLGYLWLAALVLIGASPTQALANDDQGQAAAWHHEHGSNQGTQSAALVRIIRESTERFRDVSVAEAEGYGLLFGCVSGDDSGAMGMHFVNGSLIGDDVLDPTRPEIVIYEPTANGRLRLIGADFLVFADVWDSKHDAPPQLRVSCSTCSRRRTVSGSRRSIRCTCGHGRKTRPAPSSTGTPGCRVTLSADKRNRPFVRRRAGPAGPAEPGGRYLSLATSFRNRGSSRTMS